MKFEDWIKYQQAEQVMSKKEQVKHPDHYNWIPGIECIDVVGHFPFNLGNAIKYIWRNGKKQNVSAINDLEKAKYYLELEIDRLNKEQEFREKDFSNSDDTPASGSAAFVIDIENVSKNWGFGIITTIKDWED